MKNKKPKVFSTPEGLRYSASCSFSNAALAWIANMIWQVVMLFVRAQGVVSLILSLLGFAFLLYGAILAYNAFESEIQADAMLHEKTDRMLQFLKKAVMVCIIARTILTLFAMAFGFLLSASQTDSSAVVLDAGINLVGDIFSSVNLLGAFAYKIFLHEGDQQKIKIFSLLSMISVIAHFILSLFIHFLQLGGYRSNLLSYTSLFVTIACYCLLFLMFEARKVYYQPNNQ